MMRHCWEAFTIHSCSAGPIVPVPKRVAATAKIIAKEIGIP
jgi:hypothetical protein